MGKKSNAKKTRRKLVEKEQKETSKGFFKKLFQKPPKKKTKKSVKAKTVKSKTTKTKPKTTKKKTQKKKTKIDKNKILGGALAVIMIAILASVGYLLFQKAFSPRPIAKLLPEGQTIGLIEINSNTDHYQHAKTLKLLENHPDYSKEILIEKVENKFQINYENDVEPWIGRQVGIAMIESKSQKGETHTVYFAEIFSQKNAEKFIDNSPNKGNYFAIMDDYLVSAETPEAIAELKTYQNSETKKLYDSAAYRKIDDNLPISKMAYIYINFEKVDDSVLRYMPYLSENGLTPQIIQPFLKLFGSEGMAVIAQEDKLVIQSFISLNTEKIKNGKYIEYREKYNADLMQYVSEDAIAYWGGENFESQIKRLMEILTGGEERALSAIEIFLQNYTEKYFGPEVSLEEDILPLLGNEFGLGIEQVNGENIYKLLIELEDSRTEDADFQKTKLQEMAVKFAKIAAAFEPKTVEHILKDGTVSQEIIAVPEEIIEQESTYEDAVIHEILIGKQDFGIFYAIIDNTAIFSTNKKGIISAIDTKNSKISPLKSSENFTNIIAPILRNSDEISYFNIEKLFPSLELFSSVSSGRNYFNDGISTINYLRIK